MKRVIRPVLVALAAVVFVAAMATAGGPLTTGPGLTLRCTVNGQVPTWNVSSNTWTCVAGSSISGLTTNTIPKATSPSTIGNSSITDNGTTVAITNESVFSQRNVGTTFTSANADWDAFDTTAMAAGVGGSIIFEGNYTSGGSHTALGGIKALKENSTSTDFGGDLVLGARQNGSGDITEILRLIGSSLGAKITGALEVTGACTADSTLGVTGLLTASGGLTSTAGTTALGVTNVSGQITSDASSTSAIREEYTGTDTQGTTDHGNGPAWRLGINSTGRRSIMLVDSAASTLNSTNTALDFTVGATQGAEINAVSTGWSVSQQLTLNGSSLASAAPLMLFNTTGDTAFVGASGYGCLYNTNASGACEFNATGYQNGTTQFRAFRVRDGKGNIQLEISPSGINNDVLVTPPMYGASTSAPLAVGDGLTGYNAYAGKHYEWNDEWMGIASSTTSPSNFAWLGSQYQVQASGTVILKNVAAQGHPGVASWDTNSATAGAFGALVTAQDIDFTAGNYTYEWVGGFPTLSSSSSASASEYIALVGFIDTTTNIPNQVDGCYFAYDKGNALTNGTNTTNLDIWSCWCASNTTRTTFKMDGSTVSNESFTTVNEPVAALTYPNTNLYHLKIVMTGTTRAEFYVNGTKSCDINTNIPSGIVRATGAGFGIWSESANGTASRQIDTDYTSLQYDMTSARSP